MSSSRPSEASRVDGPDAPAVDCRADRIRVHLWAGGFDLPVTWQASFELVVEIRTLQSLPPDHRRGAAEAVASTVASGGRLFVRTAGREPDEPLGSGPWPLMRRELDAFTGAGLVELELRDEPPGPDRQFRTFTAIYARRA